MPITGASPDVPVAVRVYRSTNQTIPTGNWTPLAFDNQRWDDPDDDQWSIGAPTRLVCRVAGLYVITGIVYWAAGNDVGLRGLNLYLNATNEIATIHRFNLTLSGFAQAIATAYKFSVGDFVELRVYQNSGVNRDIQRVGAFSPEFSMVRCV